MILFPHILDGIFKAPDNMRLDMTREELKKRMDELARRYAETHDKEVKVELEELSRQIAKMKKRLV